MSKFNNQLFFFTAFLLFAICKAYGQQLVPFTLYRDKWNLINPAAISNNYILTEFTSSFSASYRSQFYGLGEAAPQTIVVNAEKILEDPKIVLGIQLFTDKTGLISQTGGFIQFAYRLKLDRRKEKYLSIGLSPGLLNYRSKLQGSDFPVFESGIEPISNFALEANIGVFYMNEDQYYFGVSIPQLLGAKAPVIGHSNPIVYPALSENSRFIFAVAGLYIPFDFFSLANSSSFIDASAWIRYRPGQLPQVDANIRYQMNQIFWVGTGFSTNKIGHAETGFLLGNDGRLKLAISYDFSFLSPIARLGNSLEIGVTFSLD